MSEPSQSASNQILYGPPGAGETFETAAAAVGHDGKTRMDQGRYLDLISTDHGHRKVAQIRPTHVFVMRDKFADTPGKANNWLSVFKSLMKLATRMAMRADNRASDVAILKIGEHEPGPADLLDACLAEATPMTRMAIATGLCSRQRIGDCIRMQYGWITSSIMEFTRQKSARAVTSRT